MMFGKGGGKLWCGQGTGDRGGTLFSPQALLEVQVYYFFMKDMVVINITTSCRIGR